MECILCGAKDFDLQDGFYFCNECGTQSQDIREQVCDHEYDEAATGPKELKGKKKSKESKEKEKPEPWYRLEAFQCMLKANVEALISFGVDESLRDVVKYLWFAYINKSGQLYKGEKFLGGVQASNSDVKDEKSRQKESIKEQMEMQNEIDQMELEGLEFYKDDDPLKDLLNQASNAEEDEWAPGEQNTSPANDEGSSSSSSLDMHDPINSAMPKFYGSYLRQDFTVTLAYLGLRWLNEPITANDLARWAREGHLPYHKASKVLPPHMKFTGQDCLNFCRRVKVNPLKVSYYAMQISRSLKLKRFPFPNLELLRARLIIDLDLPECFHNVVGRLMEVGKYRPEFAPRKTFFRSCYYLDEMIMTYIMISIKLVYFLDGENEKHGRIRKSLISIVDENMESFYSWANRQFLKQIKRLADGVPETEQDLRFLLSYKNYSSFCSLNVFNTWHPRDAINRTIMTKETRACLKPQREHYHQTFAGLVPELKESIESEETVIPLSSFPLSCTRNGTDSGEESSSYPTVSSTQTEQGFDYASSTEASTKYLRYFRSIGKRQYTESYQFLLTFCARRIEVQEEDLQYFVDITENYLFPQVRDK